MEVDIITTEASIAAHRSQLEDWWQIPVVRDAFEDFLAKHPNCAYHMALGIVVPADVPHHAEDTDYHDLPTYLATLSRAIPCCNRCHTAGHHGKDLCPICKEHYKPFEAETCYHCLPDEKKIYMEADREKWKKVQKDLRLIPVKKHNDWVREYKTRILGLTPSEFFRKVRLYIMEKDSVNRDAMLYDMLEEMGKTIKGKRPVSPEYKKARSEITQFMNQQPLTWTSSGNQNSPTWFRVKI